MSISPFSRSPVPEDLSMEPASKSIMYEGSSLISKAAPDALADFMVAVRPLQRIVYLVAFATIKDGSVAEDVAVNALSSAFRVWDRRQTGDGLKLCLIRTALSEARNYLHRNSPAVRENYQEDIGSLIVSQPFSVWLPISRDAVRNGTLRGTLMRAIHELSAGAAVTLLLRDVFHLTTVEIATSMEESQQKVRARLAYARIAVCVKLAGSVSDCNVAGKTSLAAIA